MNHFQSPENPLAKRYRLRREEELLDELRESRNDYCSASAEYSATIRANSPAWDQMHGTHALARAADAIEKHFRAWRAYAEMVRVQTGPQGARETPTPVSL